MSRQETPRGQRRAVMHTLPAGLAVVLLALASAFSVAQSPDPDFPVEWSKVEPHEKTIAYRKSLVDGVFEEGERAFLVNNALPQLGLPANRGGIDRVRRRMRDVLCGESGTEAKALDSALRTTLGFMKVLAANEKADAVVRVNATLLIGELRAKGKPWPPAAAALVEVLGDPKMPVSVRIAAAAGLARHVEAGTAPAATLGPLLVKLVASPMSAGGTEGENWLAARALAMLTQLGVAVPADGAAAVAAVLNDGTRPLDVRVRAAAALGACAQAGGTIDAGLAVKTIRELALAALRDRQQADGAFNPPPSTESRPGAVSSPEPPVPVLVCRRAAWRLAMLARGLQSDDGAGGIAAIAGNGSQAARDLATVLRTAATRIDAAPDESSLDAALAELSGEPAPASGAPAPQAANQERPEAEAAPPFANPFGK